MSAKKNLLKTEDYGHFLDRIKKDIQQSQIKAAIAVNQELILLYWRIGKGLIEKIDHEGWGSKIITTIASDLARLFPDLSGFSARNLVYMRKFAEIYPDFNCAAAAAQIPWGHNMVIMDKVENNDQRFWYVQKCLENGWSRSVLTMWIESNLYGRQGKAISNFKITLPDPHSDLAQQMLKDPYNFSFLTISEKAKEQEIEQGLKDNLIAEYALQDIKKPMGIAGYVTELIASLPKKLKGSLPTVEEFEAEFERITAQKSDSKKNIRKK